jgi:hypothetical protein
MIDLSKSYHILSAAHEGEQGYMTRYLILDLNFLALKNNQQSRPVHQLTISIDKGHRNEKYELEHTVKHHDRMHVFLPKKVSLTIAVAHSIRYELRHQSQKLNGRLSDKFPSPVDG